MHFADARHSRAWWRGHDVLASASNAAEGQAASSAAITRESCMRRLGAISRVDEQRAACNAGEENAVTCQHAARTALLDRAVYKGSLPLGPRSRAASGPAARRTLIYEREERSQTQ